MALRRACSYQATFKTPETPDNYGAILVTLRQDGVNLINKDQTELTIDGDYVILQLDQEETKLFTAGRPALIQIRCYESQYNAPGSAAFQIDVAPALNDEILGS